MLGQVLRRFSRVTVCEAHEFQALSALSGASTSEFISQAGKILGDKYKQFLPFYLESRITTINKRYVMKMELLPESKQLEVTSLQIGSLHVERFSVSDVVPVTDGEFETAHTLGRMTVPPSWLDLEMIYASPKTGNFFVFDKDVNWKEDGLAHAMLSMEARFDEHEWMDFHAVKQAHLSGGKRFLDD